MNKKNRILIVGYNYKSIFKCISEGFEVDVLIDKWDYQYGNIEPLMLGERRIYVEECANATLAISALYHYNIDKNEYHAVFTDYEFTVVTAGILKSILNVKNGIDFEQAVFFRDKYAQKRKLASIVPVANNQLIENLVNFDFKDLKINFPMVLKPLAGAGAENTVKVESQEQLKKLFKTLTNKGYAYNSYLIEEFIEGQELYIDGIVYESKINLFTISQYWEPLLKIKEHSTIKTFTLHPSKYNSLYAEAQKFLSKIFEELKFRNGVFHMEVFLTRDNKLVFSECAARSGGGMMDQAFKTLYDVSLKESVADIFLETYKDNKPKIKNIITGFALIPTINKSVNKLPTIQELKKIEPTIQEVIYEWSPGDELPDITKSSTKRIGMFLVTSDSEVELKKSITKVLNYFSELK